MRTSAEYFRLERGSEFKECQRDRFASAILKVKQINWKCRRTVGSSQPASAEIDVSFVAFRFLR